MEAPRSTNGTIDAVQSETVSIADSARDVSYTLTDAFYTERTRQSAESDSGALSDTTEDLARKYGTPEDVVALFDSMSAAEMTRTYPSDIVEQLLAYVSIAVRKRHAAAEQERAKKPSRLRAFTGRLALRRPG